MEINIIDLIPVGKENAIKREQLTRLCFQYGLIADVKDKDRAMRDLIGEARMEHPIINMSQGMATISHVKTLRKRWPN